MHRHKPPTTYSSLISREPAAAAGITRLQFLKGVAGVGVAAAAGGMLAGCGGGSASAGQSSRHIASIADLGKVGGTLVVVTYQGYEGGDAIKPWLATNHVDRRFQSINSQQEATTKLKGAGGGTVDVVELALLEGDSYVDMRIPLFLDLDWFPNGKRIRPFFADLFRQPDGTLSGIPFVWAATPSNYRPDKADPIESWSDLLKPAYRDRITMIDDALANVATASLALGHEDPSKLTRDQLDEIGSFLKRMVAQARTITPSYGDMVQQLASGEVYATFSGWSALEVFAAGAGAKVASAYPREKSVGVVDAHAIPRSAPNKGTAAAFINEFLSDDMQRYVSRDLASGVVVNDAATLLGNEKHLTFDYGDLDQLLEDRLAFVSAAPLVPEAGYVSRQDWLDVWEAAKA